MNLNLKLISKEDLNFIASSAVFNKTGYMNALCSCLDELSDVPGAKIICDNFVKSFREGQIDINRNFVQLLLAYKFKRLGILDSLEMGNPPLDFLLLDSLGIELTRLGDNEDLIKSKIENFIESTALAGYKDFEIEIRLKTFQIKEILAALKRDLFLLLEKRSISNNIYDLNLQPRFGGSVSMPLIPGERKVVCLSNKVDYALKIEFITGSKDLLSLILAKNSRSAAQRSSVLIIDLSSGSSHHFSLDYIAKELDRIKNSLPASNLAIIVAVNFYFKGGTIECRRSYIIRGREDKRIVAFENIFLKNLFL
ncbi:MAG: hypothetical protein WC456_01340 [Patescibacteria group bacterium]